MAQCIVIADEITGASSVGAQLEKNRCTVCSLMSARGLKNPQTSGFDCLVYSTNSRYLTQEKSYQIVFSAARLLKSPEVKLYAKRIDPAMRGNTCAETQALLDALGDESRVAIVVPAFPAIKRTNVGGYILVDGKPLQKSLVGQDDTPATTGRVADLFTEIFHYKAEAVHLRQYAKGPEALAEHIRTLADNGARAIVMDCTSQEDINLIADAVMLSGLEIIAVDPGPFTATLARKVMRSQMQKSISSKAKILGLIGGHNPLIAAQVEQLRLEENPLIITVHNLELLKEDQTRMAEINRVVDEIVTHCDGYTETFAVSDNIGANSQLNHALEEMIHQTNRSEHEALDIISAAYGQIAQKVLERKPEFQAVYSTGAEYTTAVCRELKALGLHIMGQVLPLTSYGELIGGDKAGLKYVTSASSATDTNTVTDAIQYLKRKLEI
ncbi:MAG: four-carbon acid sugar kinase family protein [Succinivibrio sp.]|nr:four-carbon acid sugar kinase family protein [Succinivibrio sp.]